MLQGKFPKITDWRSALVAGLLLTVPQSIMAQDNIFAPGWIMDNETSALRFQSVKNVTKVESSTFGTYIGTIDDSGFATVRVLLDSVDTKVDLRNVRMRFLLFETFQFPEAVITMQIDPAQLADLEEVRRKVFTTSYTIELHGVSSTREAEIAVTLLGDDKVSVTSATPISLPTADFNLDAGVAKLEDAAKVVIIPSATVTFDFTFDRAASAEEYAATTAAIAQETGFDTVAMEEEGDFSVEACKGRFEIMSRTDNINFARGSAALDDTSGSLLDSIAGIIARCPDLVIQIGGHTDSDGSAALNQSLSEARAQSVRAYLLDVGTDAERITSVGFGEASPLVPNDSAENKRRNRRIEFTVVESE
ncbi:OmpA family protein [Yoonia sediminilitoris]|uniref:OmpA family protein n=1 Tax=Yoonia sediminilitoris TaxID=1286148 RepID=A0A2T6KAE9_9RHOB|nr:OmpA family protein [Yoonia sediminilitoris]PUB11826.1 OmpA family protein [Yoonia sediminilitoris]RCW91903.1 OmpA family protein [Yoonia sediminilitoris]